MRFYARLTGLVSILAGVEAAIHNVQVGNGSLVYSPNTTYAAVGDTVVFHYWYVGFLRRIVCLRNDWRSAQLISLDLL